MSGSGWEALGKLLDLIFFIYKLMTKMKIVNIQKGSSTNNAILFREMITRLKLKVKEGKSERPVER